MDFFFIMGIKSSKVSHKIPPFPQEILYEIPQDILHEKTIKINHINFNKYAQPHLWNISFELEIHIYKKLFRHSFIYSTNDAHEAKQFLLLHPNLNPLLDYRSVYLYLLLVS